MFSLQDLLGPQKGSEAIEEISQNVGADSSAVNAAIQAALPMLINGLANNAATPQGAESLSNALEKDNHAGILDNIGGLGGMIFGGGQQAAPPREADAGGILGHILGGDQAQVAEKVSRESGLEMGQAAQILMFLAPIVMGYIGRQKQEQNVGPDGLGGLLGGLLGGVHSSGQSSRGGSIMDMLDRDGDGSSLDDIASIAFEYATRK